MSFLWHHVLWTSDGNIKNILNPITSFRDIEEGIQLCAETDTAVVLSVASRSEGEDKVDDIKTNITRGKSQVMFNHLPESVFHNDWYKVESLDVKEIEDTKHLLAWFISL